MDKMAKKVKTFLKNDLLRIHFNVLTFLAILSILPFIYIFILVYSSLVCYATVKSNYKKITQNLS